MRSVLLLLFLIGGCGLPPSAVAPARAARRPLAFHRQSLTLECESLSFDLLRATPVRSARVYDLLSHETFTRRYFLVQAGGRPYALKTEQLEGEPYPRKIAVETPAGFRLVLLDRRGNVVSSEGARDLGE
jgi:hypothetical protein